MGAQLDISISVRVSYSASQPCDLLLQIEAAETDDQHVKASELLLPLQGEVPRIPAEDGIGERLWTRAEHSFDCRYTAVVQVMRAAVDVSTLEQSPLASLSGDVVTYLMPSRYCHPEDFHDLVTGEFGGLVGGALMAEVSAWIGHSFRYVPGASDAGTTASDTLKSRQGVCRDYAHVLIAVARAAGIPARMVSVYSPDVDPPDFHAVTEVFLEGAWHLIDPTGMAEVSDIVRIGVGRDAADVSFLTAYGFLDLKEQLIHVERIG